MIQIDEWRATVEKIETIPSPAAIEVLNKTCNKVMDIFPIWIKSRGFKLENFFIPDVYLSIIPADLNFHGQDSRNLNDISGRFLQRSRNYDSIGNAIPIWGYFQRSTSYIYIRNDILNKDLSPNGNFQSVFAHELFHALSWNLAIYQQHKISPDNEEEVLADLFAKTILKSK